MGYSAEKYVQYAERSDMDFDVQKLKCIFTYFEEYIDESVYQVLNDSPTDPDYSAVAATSLIKKAIYK